MSDLDRFVKKQRRVDRIFNRVGILCTVSALTVLVLLLLDLTADGLSRLDAEFFRAFPSRRPEQAGILSAWVGSALLMLVTGTTAIPLGVAAGIYLEEYASKNWTTRVIEVNITNLAAVPSIVFGLMALGLFVYQFQFGQSVLSGGLALAFLALPIVIVATREALRAIPESIREAAFALGASRWQVVRHHLLPYSAGGIATGVIISLSRAVGETAPLVTIGALTFIAFLPPAPLSGSPPFVSFEWLESPFTVLPIQIFNWVSRPGDDFLANAAAASLVLMGGTLLMNAVAITVRHRMRRRIKW
jgi:phosphate transport system permease protein